MRLETFAVQGETSAGGTHLAGAIFGGGHPVRGRLLRRFPDLALVWVLAGSAEFDDGRKIHLIQPGDLIALPPRTPGNYGPLEGEVWDEAYLTLQGPIAQAVEAAILASENPTFLFPAIGSHVVPNVLHLLQQIRHESSNAGTLGKIWQVAGIALEQIAGFSKRSTGDIGLAPDWIDEARRMLASELHRPLKLEEVAGNLKLGEETFRKRFTAAVGVPPATYRLQVKMSTVKSILEHKPESSCTELAALLGFSDFPHFWRTFKKWEGTSPRQYARAAHFPAGDVLPAMNEDA